MNISHRSLWNPSLGAWVAVSEITTARGKRSGGASRTAVARGVLALTFLLGGASALAGGDGGDSGAQFGLGAAGSGTGTGGAGGAISGNGGTGGGIGGNGGDGSNGTVASGGGGGGTGVLITTSGSTNTVAVAGGSGGSGGDGTAAGGGGGGGAGAVAAAGLTGFTNSGSLTGGNGGSGGQAPSGGNGGGGGAGAVATAGLIGFTNSGTITGGSGGSGGINLAGAGSTTAHGGNGGAGVAAAGLVGFTNSGSITGGNGGSGTAATVTGGNGGNGEGGALGATQTGTFRQGGAGVIGSNLSIINAGIISGGLSAGNVRANAITFTGGSNSLTLQTGSVLTGAIGIDSGATALIVAGDTGLSLGNAILLGGDGTVDTHGNDLMVSGVISGVGSLGKTGTGILTLSSATTYSGVTTISAGTLALSGTGTLTNSSAVNLATGATLDISNASSTTIRGLGNTAAGQTGSVELGISTLNLIGANSTFGGVIKGFGSLELINGTQVLTGLNTYSGTTSIIGGTLRAGAANTLSANSAVNLGPGTLNLNSFSQSISALSGTSGATVSLGSAALTTNVATGTSTYDGIITGNLGSLTKTGAGTLVLSGDNTYTGGTTISGGTLQLGSGGVTGSLNTGAITNNGALVVNRSNSVVLSGDISGTGTLTKTGTGGLILLGTNSYVGTTTISGGSLQVGAGSTTGTLGSGAVVNNGQLGFNRTDAITVNNNISGAGTLNQIGPGTLTLAGSNTYSGGTFVTGGTLQGNTDSLQGNITNNAVVVFNQATNGTYAGNMVGTGSLTKTNNGTLVLTGTNSYSGGTSINLGTLQGNSDSLQGAIHNGTAVVFDQATNGSYTGAMDGLGTLTKTGAGTLVLSGANTYSGGTTVSAGALQGSATSLRGNITNNAAVNFDQATTGTYTGVMGGTGNLTKLGAGNLLLTGVNTYNGATSVNAGTLSINGSIANSAVTVNSGGTLGGSGTLGSTTIASGGVLAPGNSIGTLTVNGNLSFAAGSIYRVEVDAAGANDRINATGTATINGGTVDVQAGAGTYAANTQYTILNATGGRTGNFAGVTSNLAFLTPTLGYDTNNVFLTLARNDINFSAVAVTPNQLATSTALQNANAGATGDMAVVQTALTGLSAPQARATYDSASGAGILALRRAGAGFATSFGNQLQARLGAQASGGSALANSFGSQPILLAANDHLSDLMAPVSDSAPQKFSLTGDSASRSSSSSTAGKGLWVRGYGGYGNTDSDGNAAASRLRSSGLSVGFDQEVEDGLRLGAAMTSGTSRLSTDNNESGKTRSSAVALYGSYATGPWNFSGSASVSWGSNHMDRNVVVGAINRVASSDFDSNTLAAYGEATYSLPMDGWTLQPLAGLSLSRNKADGFTETGAGALNLQVAGQTINSSKSMLGAKASFDTGRIRFEPRVIWAHEFGDLNTPMTAQFQGAATASPFQVSGAALKRDMLILGLGATGSIGKGIDLFADVQAEHNAQQRNLAVLVGLRSRW